MISSRTRARSWYAKCGVAGPTSSSIASFVGSATRGSLTRIGHIPMGSVGSHEALVEGGRNAARDRLPLGLQLHGHEVRLDARLPAAGVLVDPLRRRRAPLFQPDLRDG